MQRDFLEPRDIAGVAPAPSTIAMLASKWHQLWRATWHTVRGQWPNFKHETTRTEIAKLGWEVVRPPRKKREDGGNVILGNGAGEDSTGDWVKTPDYFTSVMRQWEANYTSPSVLASLRLGALGNLIEFTTHNAMHNRWMTPARDPETGQPSERPTFDFSDTSGSPKYDYLGEFYSSHVNPVFWRLHGWVDDRIEGWFKAQEASRPRTIRRRKLHGVDWVTINKPWVTVDEPFVGVSLESHGGHQEHASDGMHTDHDHHAGDDLHADEIDTMLKVMAAIENDDKQAALMSLNLLERAPTRGEHVNMRFEMPDQL
ncbi:MAG: hypothetical protein JO106_11360 [Mycobacterium sp.]|nr:hypothetical protein [Mycobacterium sp.]